MNLAIGTANFTQVYGVTKNTIVNKKNLKKIFNIIRKNKINYLDTAFDYGLIEELKNHKKFNTIKIITKVKLPKINKIDFINELENKIKNELVRINKKSFEALLIHNIIDLNSIHTKYFIKKIKLLKKKKLINKIGVSIYDPNDLKIVFSKLKPEIIQAPINIFDNRLIKSKWFNIIKKKKIIVQARSIFLQGLLIKKISLLKKLNINYEIFQMIKKLDKWCKINQTSRLEACLTYIKKIKEINITTVGVNNPKELLEILKIIKKNKKIKFKDFSTNKLKIIDPRKWE